MRCNLKDKKNLRIKQLVEYFDFGILKDSDNPKYRRAIKLEKMIKLYSSDLDNVRKIDEMSKIYKTSSNFRENFEDLMPYQDDETVGYFANAVSVIGNYYKVAEETGLKEVGRNLLEMEDNKYFEDYEYACYFVRQYIAYDKSPFLVDFLKDSGLKELHFNRFVDIVAELNDKLFDQYCIKREVNKEMRKSAAIRKVDEIKYGVLGEKIENCEKYDALDFYSNLPFYSIETSKELLDDFGVKKGVNLNQNMKLLIRHIEPEFANTIMEYIAEKKLYFSNYQSEVKKEAIMKTKYILNGRELTDEDKENMIRYMEDRNIPFIIDAFTIVKRRYANNALEHNKKLQLV